MNGSQVRLENISKKFGSFQALRNVNLDIARGEFFSLLGPSGCGKTTALRIIAGFEDPTTGSVFLDADDVTALPSNKRHVNTVFQSYALFPHLSVFENVAFSQRLKKLPESEIRRKVEESLELIKLSDQTSKLPAQLSGGQKQRVAIARALINQPSVLLLDEPLSALDAKLRQHMLYELDAIHDQVGITFIYVTHDQQEALSVSDRVAIMDKGDILQIGTPSEVYEAPVNMFVAEFIGDSNVLRGTVRSAGERFSHVDIPSLGDILVDNDKPVQAGDKVTVTIRPEKIRITREKPEQLAEDFNCLAGTVDEVMYTGFQSKFYVKVDGDVLLRVFKQHVKFYSDEAVIRWKDPVYVWWSADDGFIVEAARP